MITLDPFQEDALDRSAEAMLRGCRRQLIVHATGLGKTVVAAMLRRHHTFDGKIMFLTHREKLADQSEEKLRWINPSLFVGMEMASQHSAPMDTFIVGSIATIGLPNSPRLKKFDPAEFSAVIHDECFPAGTLIDGCPIERLEVGDFVLSYDGSNQLYCMKEVTRIFKNPAPRQMVAVYMGYSKLLATLGHPIFTMEGWKYAQEVYAGDYVMCHVQRHGGLGHSNRLGAGAVQENDKGLLLSRVRQCVPGQAKLGDDGSDQSEVRLEAHEGQQSNAQPGESALSEQNLAGDRPQTAGSRREWDGAQFTTVSPYGSNWWRDRWLEGRDAGINWEIETKWLSACVQVRPSSSGIHDWDRGRWPESWLAFSQRTRSKEGSPAVWVRVDRVEIQECGDTGEPGCLCPDGFVYNLEVEGTHTYFANGVLVHNCHHIPGDKRWIRVCEHFGLMEPDTPHGLLSLGFTATPNRADGKGLRRFFDEIVHTFSLMDGINQGYLADLDYYKIRTKTSLDKVKTRAGDFAANELEKTVNTPERNGKIVLEWFARCQRQKTLAFCVDLQHALDLAEAFAVHGVEAEAVWGEDPDRKAKFARFRDHETTILTNCQLATEGFDDWSIMWGIMARPTRSALLYQQMLGRLTRIPPEVRQDYRTLWKAEEAGFQIAKRCAGVLDFVDNCRHPAISLPYLIGLPAEMDIKGKSIRKAKEQFDRVAQQFPTANLQDVRSLDELDSVAEKISLFQVSYPPEISKLTELAWRKAGDGFFLPVDRSRITIAQDLREDWWVRGTVGGKSIEIAAQNLVGAFAAADRAIMDAGAPKVLLARDSRWRDREPSQPQIDRCRKIGLPIPHGATRGMVSAALDAHFQKGRR